MKTGNARKKRLLPDGPEKSRHGGFLRGVRSLKSLAGVLLVLILVLLYAIFFSSKGLGGYRHQRRLVHEMEAKVRTLSEENRRASARNEYFQNHPEAQERLIRQYLGWAAEGEIVFEFIPSESEKTD